MITLSQLEKFSFIMAEMIKAIENEYGLKYIDKQ